MGNVSLILPALFPATTKLEQVVKANCFLCRFNINGPFWLKFMYTRYLYITYTFSCWNIKQIAFFCCQMCMSKHYQFIQLISVLEHFKLFTFIIQIFIKLLIIVNRTVKKEIKKCKRLPDIRLFRNGLEIDC